MLHYVCQENLHNSSIEILHETENLPPYATAMTSVILHKNLSLLEAFLQSDNFADFFIRFSFALRCWIRAQIREQILVPDFYVLQGVRGQSGFFNLALIERNIYVRL